MSQEIANNLSTFKGHIEEYDQGYRNLVKDFESVKSHMRALNGMWTGEAHDTLIHRFEEDSRTVQAMIDYIKEILGDLNFAHTEYTRCENEVRSMVDAIRV